MKTTISLSLLAVSLSSLVGCGFAIRSPDMYRDDTKAVIDRKAADIKACYDGILKSQTGAQGTVVVHFRIEKDTGRIVSPQVDASKSNAPPAVGSCVVQSIDGLKIDPPDARDGDATFTWQFHT